MLYIENYLYTSRLNFLYNDQFEFLIHFTQGSEDSSPAAKTIRGTYADHAMMMSPSPYIFFRLLPSLSYVSVIKNSINCKSFKQNLKFKGNHVKY